MVDENGGSRAESHQSFADANTDDVDVESFSQRRQTFSESTSQHHPTSFQSRRNTVTYDLSVTHKSSNILLTDLVQQLLPPDQAQQQQNLAEEHPLQRKTDSNGSDRRRASSVFSRFVGCRDHHQSRFSQSTVASGPSAREKKKELRLARISLCIVWLFIFCHVWKLIPTFYTTFVSEDNNVGFDVQWPDWLNIIDRISHTFITLNSSLNFLIYVVV